MMWEKSFPNLLQLKVDFCYHAPIICCSRPKDIPVVVCFLPAVVVAAVHLSWMTSSKTVLLHLGHLGSSSDSITYMRHLGHPTSIIDVASGLVEYRRYSSCWLSSDETHELGGDVGDTVSDRLGDSTRWWFSLGGDKFSFRSSFGPFLRLIFFSATCLICDSFSGLPLDIISPCIRK